MQIDEGRIFIDTNILIYSTLENDVRFKSAHELLLSASGYELYISVQNLAEMYPNLTGPKMEIPDTPKIAHAKIKSIADLPNLHVLPLTRDVQNVALELCEKYGICKQHYYDAQIAATMIANGITTLVTENINDFKEIEEIHAVNPF